MTLDEEKDLHVDVDEDMSLTAEGIVVV